MKDEFDGDYELEVYEDLTSHNKESNHRKIVLKLEAENVGGCLLLSKDDVSSQFCSFAV